MNGRGVKTYANGDKYDGEWKDGKKHGRGVFTWPSGSKYDGEYKDDYFNGRGVFTWPNGVKYDGEWKDNKKNGRGMETWADGRKYVGEYKDDKMNGRGVFTYKNGMKYDGEWKDDKKNGRGMETFVSGRKYDGEYKDDKKHGHGVWTFNDGISWKGSWKEDNPEGPGTWRFTDGHEFFELGPPPEERKQSTAPQRVRKHRTPAGSGVAAVKALSPTKKAEASARPATPTKPPTKPPADDDRSPRIKRQSTRDENELLRAQLAALQAQNRGNPPQKAPKSGGDVVVTYRRKISVHFGISQYKHWSKLNNTVRDAEALAERFRDVLEFDESVLVTEDNVTKAGVEKVFAKLSKCEQSDLVVVTYSGHGASLPMADGSTGGFIVPIDAPASISLMTTPDYISMDDLEKWAKTYLKALHVVILLDCCFSGLLSSRGLSTGRKKKVHKHLKMKCRYVINAGSEDEVVSDGRTGHSPFVDALLKSSAGTGDDEECDIEMLKKEIENLVCEMPEVNQTPTGGTLAGDQGGCAFLALPSRKEGANIF